MPQRSQSTFEDIFVLGAPHQENLRIKPEKCFFGFKEVIYVGGVDN